MARMRELSPTRLLSNAFQRRQELYERRVEAESVQLDSACVMAIPEKKSFVATLSQESKYCL